MQIKKYYVTGHTASGRKQLLASNIQGLKVIKLTEGSWAFQTEVLQSLITSFEGKTSIEVLKSSLSKSYLEGVILREKGIAVLAKEAPAIPEAYMHFAAGLKTHDKLEAIFIKEMNFKLADNRAAALIKTLLDGAPQEERQGYTYQRFFGTNTIDGVVNEVPHLISDLDTVYHIKGRSGTGKSTFMKKIAKACLAHGLDIEQYHCSFDPKSIDMILVPALNMALFDSTDPHAFEPQDLKREQVIDLYEIAVKPGTDEKYEKEITEVTKLYKSYMKKGIQEIKKHATTIMEQDKKIKFTNEEVEQALQKLQKEII